MTKLIVAIRNCVKAPNDCLSACTSSDSDVAKTERTVCFEDFVSPDTPVGTQTSRSSRLALWRLLSSGV